MKINQPALKAVLILSIGIIVGRFLSVPFSAVLSCSAFLTILTFILFFTKRHKSLLQLSLTLSLISIGLLRYQQMTHLFPENHTVHYLNLPQTLTLQGYLTKDPTEKPGRVELIVEAESLTLRDTLLSTCGKLLVSLYQDPYPPLRYGDEITITGQLQRPRGLRNPGGFDYREYLQRKNIRAIFRIEKNVEIQPTGTQKGNLLLRKIVYPARRFAIKTIDKTTSGQSRSLLRALLMGERGTVSPEVRDSFAKAGIIHVLAVSGLHVGFVLLILTTIFGLLRLPYPARVLLTILGLIFYALLTEAKAPVVRATTMASIYLIGTLIERRTNPFNVIGVAALGILLFKPQDLFDVGFQLSFTAVLSIVYFYQKLNALPFVLRIHQGMANNPVGKYLMPVFLVSLSAQIGTLPLTAFYFNRIPLLSIAVNILAIPLVGLIVALGFVTLLSSLFSLWVAAAYGALNQVLLTALTTATAWIGALPVSHITPPTPHLMHVLVYFFLLLFLVNIQNVPLRKTFTFLLLFSLNLLVWKNVAWNDDGKIVWIQLDVGQGDAALLHMPRGKTLLIDGGDKNRFFDNGERIIAPYLRKKGIRTLDAILLSHPHNDHVGGLIYVLQNFKVKEVITAGTPFDSNLHREFLNLIQEKHIPMRTVTAPDSLLHFPGIKLYFLSPVEAKKTQLKNRGHDVNNQSLVTRILFGKTKLLFQGDAEREAEEDILQSGLPIACEAIKVGHHGSITSSTFPYIQKTLPKHAVISVGENNRFRHPSNTVIRRFRAWGSTVYRTDLEGALMFKSDGETLKRIDWRKTSPAF